jgi:GGDEF domain-containing protein
MESAVRDSDTVSRHSGDAFVILLAEISYQSDAALIATKMLSAIGASSENAPAGTVSASIAHCNLSAGWRERHHARDARQP